ncbi:hypothetical protein [Streptomyces sp. AD55]|uniref:hypothetical protein n=1 Tax=Streptomyces sp. AD55 TaxID=3242895 RepID=UPI003528F0C2
MRTVRGVGAAVAAAVLVLSGCSGSGGGGGGPEASVSAGRVVEPREALEEYEKVAAAGCRDEGDCRFFVQRKLTAAVYVKDTMLAKDASLYSVPAEYVRVAEREAARIGEADLGLPVSVEAVSEPLRRMVGWFRDHPEG